MPKATDIRICQATWDTERFPFRTPLKFGGRVVKENILFNVRVEVETRAGQRGHGFGSMPVGNIWAWPAGNVAPDESSAAMQLLGGRMVSLANTYSGSGHPLDITEDLDSLMPQVATRACQELQISEMMPRLAQLVAASPLEAAIHDAYGKALGANSYLLLGPEHANYDLAHYLSEDFKGEYLDRYTLATPREQMPLYHLVGALDPLTAADVAQPIGDGLPETLAEWIRWNGLTHLKIKLNGDHLEWDVNRVLAVDQVAAETQLARGVDTWCYSLDFNERCPNVDYVVDFLRQIAEQSPAAMDRIQYVEQPTHRDLRANPDNKMHQAARIKPVVIDESLIDFESLQLSREMGYSGVALKACKGQTGALLMGAAAQKYGLFLCIQDLTCAGASFLHSASLSARIPTVAAIEGNGRQFCPAANVPWARQFPEMFNITQGTVGTHVLTKPGLGYT